jgi:phosphate uptake regulator
MRRKIIPHGPSSMTVSLPSSWVKLHNLKKGEELDVTEEDNKLFISPVCTNDNSKKIEVSFVDLDKDAEKNIILALHKKGYDEIKINFDKPNTTKDIHSFLNTMQLGFEIIKQEKNAILIKSISNPEAEQFDNLFRRIFRITIEYARKIEATLSDDDDITDSFLLHETSVTRISNYCKRIIVKEKKQNACFLYAIVDDIMTIVQNLSLILEEIKKRKSGVPKEFISRYHEMANLIERTYNLYYKFSFVEHNAIDKDLQNLRAQITKINLKDKAGFLSWEYLSSIEQELCSILNSILAVQF